MAIGWIMGIFFVFLTVVFVALYFFLPEWMGVTGKTAKEVISHQQGDTVASKDKEIDQTETKN